MEPAYMNFVLSLVFVLALLYGILWVVKKFGLAQVRLKTSHKKINLLEIVPLDAKRRVVLLEKDGKEHLIFVGDNSEFLIESSEKKNNSAETKKPVKSKK